MNPQAMMTPDRIRQLDTDHIERLLEENTKLQYAIDQQREDIAILHQTIGGLEWILKDREKQISLLKLRIERLMNRNGTP